MVVWIDENNRAKFKFFKYKSYGRPFHRVGPIRGPDPTWLWGVVGFSNVFEI